MNHLPEQPRSNQTMEPIVVDTAGNAYTDLTRAKESIIRSERLDSSHPLVEIDLESILTEEGGNAIALVIQDFGLLPRIIKISGEFTTMDDVRGNTRNDQHYLNAPKKLSLTAQTPHSEKTFSFDDKGLPDNQVPVSLKRGESMFWAHNGAPSDERTGYITGGFSLWELVASVPYYGEPNFSDIATRSLLRDGYTPFIGITYKGSSLSIYSLDDVHADVLYQQVRSLSDEVGGLKTPSRTHNLDLSAIIARLLASETVENRENIVGAIKEGQEAMLAVDGLKAQLLDAKYGIDSLETLLAVNKRKLSESRQATGRLTYLVKNLQQELLKNGKPKTGPNPTSSFRAETRATEADPNGHCAAIGLNPEFLFALNPEIAVKIVKGVHKGLVLGYHSDIHGGSDETMKTINAAVDSILSRLENGYWGRH